MAINKEQERNIKIFMTAAAVIVIIAIIGYMASVKKSESDLAIGDNVVDSDENYLNGNQVVIQSENSYSAEGKSIPTDVDLSDTIPAQLKEEYLVGVVDNKQLDSRNITLKYKINGTAKAFADEMITTMTQAGWQVDSQADYINATKDNKRIALSIEQVDEQSIYATLLVYLFEADSAL